MSTLGGVVRDLRSIEGSGRASADTPAPHKVANIEITAVDIAAAPPRHDGFVINESGLPIEINGARALFTKVPAVGAVAFSVGDRVRVEQMANGFWRISAGGGGGGGGGFSGLLPPHSHTGGADGDIITVFGTGF